MVAWMLHAFLTTHRSALIERCGRMVAERTEDPAPDPALLHGIPVFLASAVGNLLQNAFKFTQPRTQVTLDAYATADRVRIDVHDHCGGLPAGAVEKMFRPFSQSGEDRSGSGCVFTIDLPLYKPVARESSDLTDT